MGGGAGSQTLLEAGIGEATGFKYVTRHLGIPSENCYGFDISWSRLKVANDFMAEDTPGKQKFFVAELANIPLCDNAIDIVYTCHSIEPNGGYEEPILKELYRIAGKYLLLFEPDYAFAGNEAKKRMERHGYVKDLAGVAGALGFNVVKHELLTHQGAVLNPNNPTSVIVIKKAGLQHRDDTHPTTATESIYQCPISKTELEDCGDVLSSPHSHLMYPVIQGIPCLLESNAILGCKYQ